MSENADALAMAFRERAPWCNYEPTLAFTAFDDHPDAIESLTIASGTGNTEELEEVDLSSLTNLCSLHIEERCFLFAKRFIVHDLRHIKSIRIDRHCCTVDYTLVPGSFLSIKDCSHLESIHIGSMCFYSYSSMELESE